MGPGKRLKGSNAARTLASVHARQLTSYVDSKVRVEHNLVEAEPSLGVWHLCDRAHVLDKGKVSAGFSEGACQSWT